jgi:hypothetical protein
MPPDVLCGIKIKLNTKQGAQFPRRLQSVRREPPVRPGMAKLNPYRAVVWIMAKGCDCFRGVRFRANMVSHFPAGDTLDHLAPNPRDKMCGGIPDLGMIQGLVLEGLKIIPVLFRGTFRVGHPVNDKRLYTIQFLAGPGKRVDRQQVSLYVHTLDHNFPARQNYNNQF